MSSLKEIKTRIGSVRSTLKITSAMKLVASAKLRKAQQAVAAALPYQKTLSSVLSTLLADYASKEHEGGSPWDVFSAGKETGSVAIVAIASNTSLCGGFNANAIRCVTDALAEHPDATVYSIGRKMADAMKKAGHPSPKDFSKLSEHPAYDGAAAIAEELTEGFLSGRFSRVELVYNHFASTASQPTVREPFLPFAANPDPSSCHFEPASCHFETASCHFEPAEKSNCHTEASGRAYLLTADFIVEPDAETVIAALLPKVLKLKLYSVLLDSAAAEHAARTVAMQTATDNAEDILRDLTLEYNKGRQQKITAEILDIVGGSML
ncbi:MAG: ATP synthase F1 subunit gamma [Bacteroidales bacterium]|nr:ATP synthase F1 subunit gamma [Bacteroidales bacterium]